MKTLTGATCTSLSNIQCMNLGCGNTHKRRMTGERCLVEEFSPHRVSLKIAFTHQTPRVICFKKQPLTTSCQFMTIALLPWHNAISSQLHEQFSWRDRIPKFISAQTVARSVSAAAHNADIGCVSSHQLRFHRRNTRSVPLLIRRATMSQTEAALNRSRVLRWCKGS